MHGDVEEYDSAESSLYLEHFRLNMPGLLPTVFSSLRKRKLNNKCPTHNDEIKCSQKELLPNGENVIF